MKIYWKIKPLISVLNHTLNSPKILSYANTFDLSRRAKSSLTPTTDLFLSSRSQSKGFRFWRFLGALIIFSVPYDWLLKVQKGQEWFINMESSRFSNPGFPITTDMMSSFKSSIHASYLSYRTWLRNRWICTPLWNLDGPDLPENAFRLYTTPYSNFYFFNLTFFIFLHQVSIRCHYW